MKTQGVKVLKKKLLESLKNLVYKIVYKTFIASSPINPQDISY